MLSVFPNAARHKAGKPGRTPTIIMLFRRIKFVIKLSQLEKAPLQASIQDSSKRKSNQCVNLDIKMGGYKSLCATRSY